MRSARPRTTDADGPRVVTAPATIRRDGPPWRETLERHGGVVRAVARAHRLEHHDQEEVLQSTWLRLLEDSEALERPAAVPGWIWVTARHEALRILRAHDRETPTDDLELLTRLGPRGGQRRHDRRRHDRPCRAGA